MKSFKVLVLAFTFVAFANGAVIQNSSKTSSAPSVGQALKQSGKDGENRKGRFLLLDDATATGILGAVIGTAVTPLFGPLSPFLGGIVAPQVSNVIKHLGRSDIEDILSKSASNSAFGSYSPQALDDPRLGQLTVLRPSLPGLQPIILQNSIQELYANNLEYLKQDAIEDRFVYLGKPGSANHHDCNHQVEHHDGSYDHADHYGNHNSHDNYNHVYHNGNYGNHNSDIFKPENWVSSHHGKPGYTKTSEKDMSEVDSDTFIRSLLK